MVEKHKPRHIRDIAHIYLSHLEKRERLCRLTIMVSGDGKDCFSCFHVANVSSALASSGVSVQVLELSGLLPNVGFYLAMPPVSYILPELGDAGRMIPALNGVNISFDFQSPLEAQSGQESAAAAVVHLPPMDMKVDFQSCLETLRGRIEGESVFLLLKKERKTSPEELWERFSGVLGGVPVYVLSLGRWDRSCLEDGGSFFDLGGVDGWEEKLSDRVPAVLRDPGSTLARSYISVCESLLCRIRSARRGVNAAGRYRVQAGLRSG